MQVTALIARITGMARDLTILPSKAMALTIGQRTAGKGRGRNTPLGDRRLHRMEGDVHQRSQRHLNRVPQEEEIRQQKAVNTNCYNNSDLAHANGFMITSKGLLVCDIQILQNVLPVFSEDLPRFLVAHEICHCILLKTNDGELLAEALISRVESDCSGQICTVLEANNDITRYIHFLKECIESRPTTRYENCCSDFCAGNILGLPKNKILDLLLELKKHLGNNNCNDIDYRIKKARHRDFEGCKQMLEV